MCASSSAPERIFRPSPVEVGIIKMKPDAMTLAGVGQLFEHVASKRGGVNDIVVRLPGLEHRETVVVTRGEADIACSGILDGLDPGIGVESRRVERPSRLRIFLVVEVGVVKIPFTLPEEAVNAPMQENAETVVGKGLPCCKILRGRGVRRCCGLGRHSSCGGKKKSQQAV